MLEKISRRGHAESVSLGAHSAVGRHRVRWRGDPCCQCLICLTRAICLSPRQTGCLHEQCSKSKYLGPYIARVSTSAPGVSGDKLSEG